MELTEAHLINFLSHCKAEIHFGFGKIHGVPTICQTLCWCQRYRSDQELTHLIRFLKRKQHLAPDRYSVLVPSSFH